MAKESAGKKLRQLTPSILASWLEKVGISRADPVSQDTEERLSTWAADFLSALADLLESESSPCRPVGRESVHNGADLVHVWASDHVPLDQRLSELSLLRETLIESLPPNYRRGPAGECVREAIRLYFDQAQIKASDGYLKEQERQFAESLDAMRRPLEQLKTEIIAVVSHELRTPLTAVLGYTDILLRGLSGELNDSQRHHLSQVRAAGFQLLTLITNLLDYSSLEAGAGSFSVGPISLELILERLIDQVKGIAAEKKIALSLQMPVDLPPVRIDAQRTQQALYQIVANALKFTSSGGSVTIEAIYEPQASRIQVAVRDTGVGISPSQLDKIWNLFEQGDTSSTRRFGGLGLGLAIARKIIEAEGGSIWAESGGPGRGATFTIALPCESYLDMMREA